MFVGEKLNILVVSSYYYPAVVYGGPVTAMSKLNQALTRLGHQVTVYTTDAGGTGNLSVPQVRPVPLDGYSVWYFPRWWFGREKKPFTLFFSPAMGRKLRELHFGDFDVVVLHQLWGEPARMAAAAARRAGIPYFCYTHGAITPWGLRQKYWKKRIYSSLIARKILQQATGIVVGNVNEIQAVHQWGIRTLTRQLTLGIDQVEVQAVLDRKRLNEGFPPLQDRPFLLFLGRLSPVKGLNLLIQAFGAVAQEFPDWLLVLAGPDERDYKSHLQHLIQKNNLVNRVIFTGWVTGEAKAALLQHAEFLVHPSYSESFAIVVYEALAYGRPVIISDTQGNDRVGEMGAGLVVPPERRALSKAMGQMMGDADLRRNCAEKALALYKRHPDWEEAAIIHLAFYLEAINSQKRRIIDAGRCQR